MTNLDKINYKSSYNKNQTMTKSEHLETEDLIMNYKNKYEEISILLDRKIKELIEEKERNNLIFSKFSGKLLELESVNYQLKNFLMNKVNENEEYKRIMKDLNTNLLKNNDINEQTKEYYNNVLQDKDV